MGKQTQTLKTIEKQKQTKKHTKNTLCKNI